MRRIFIFIIALICLTTIGCGEIFNINNGEVEIPDFNFPQSIVFESSLSTYEIYQGNSADLIPSDDFHLLDLSSILFTDYAHKQRLVKVPEGTKMKRQEDGSLEFPDGTILVKTFFYYNDERDKNLGKRIIETRLLIKENDIWNISTYLWNEAQTDATLEINGIDTQVNWINANGSDLSTLYHVPSQNECITCHQSKSTMTPLGPTLGNLNRLVERNGANLNQINHLQSVGVLNDFHLNQVSEIVDYNNLNASLEERGRAYLAMNCAHCHNPDAWDAAAEQGLDFRYETPLDQTGIGYEEDEIVDLMLGGEMPFIGTTILDQEGTNLIIEFIESL